MNGFEFELPSDWYADVSYGFAEGTRVSTNGFNYISDVLNDLVGNGQYNPFGTRLSNPGLISPKDGVSDAFNDPLTVQQFNGTAISTARAIEHVVDAVTSGDLFDTGMGTVGLAVGAQYRKTKIIDVPDPLDAAGEANESSREFLVTGASDVYAIFAEAIVPFDDWGQVQLAIRREDYGGTIGSTTDPKISAEIRPNEWLSLRGSWEHPSRHPLCARLQLHRHRPLSMTRHRRVLVLRTPSVLTLA